MNTETKAAEIKKVARYNYSQHLESWNSVVDLFVLLFHVHISLRSCHLTLLSRGTATFKQYKH